MNIHVVSRHMELSAPLREYAESKVVKLQKYFDRVSDIEVLFDTEKSGHRVEVIVRAEHNGEFVASHEGKDAYAGVDDCIAKLERQLADHKKRIRNHKHLGA